jgi:hypothetical protein
MMSAIIAFQMHTRLYFRKLRKIDGAFSNTYGATSLQLDFEVLFSG